MLILDFIKSNCLHSNKRTYETAIDPKASNNPRLRWHYIEELLDIISRVLDPVYDSSIEIFSDITLSIDY